MCLEFDKWYDLWETDIETEFRESGHYETEHTEFVETQYMLYIDSQTTELDYNDAKQQGMLDQIT